MDQVMWYYQQGQQPVGPIGTADLCAKFAGADLPLTTQVYCDAIGQWAPAQTIRGFRDAAPVTDAAKPADNASAVVDIARTPPTALPRPVSDVIAATSARHPWIRLLARLIDCAAFRMVASVIWVGLVGSILAPSADELREFRSSNPMGMLTVVLAINLLSLGVLSAGCISLLGTTPGKWLLGISIRNGCGEKLTFSQALAREWNVLLLALGLMIPPLSIIFLIVAYVRLMDKGDTAWDRKLGVIFHHAPCGSARVFAAFSAAIMAIAVFMGSDAIAAFAVAHHPRISSAALSFPTIQPQPITMTPLDVPMAPDPRVSKLSGTWISMGITRSGSEKFTLRNVLVINPDGTFRQSVHVSGSDGKVRAELGRQWSGTWELSGNTFTQMVSLSSTLHYPIGKWSYEVADLKFDSLNLRRTIEPEAFEYRGRKPMFKFQRMSATIKAE